MLIESRSRHLRLRTFGFTTEIRFEREKEIIQCDVVAAVGSSVTPERKDLDGVKEFASFGSTFLSPGNAATDDGVERNSRDTHGERSIHDVPLRHQS